MTIRSYTAADRERVLEILRLNTPEFFDPRERADLEAYLADHAGTYFVVEVEGTVVGSGGYHCSPGGEVGRISWDLFDPAAKGRGHGRALVSMCLDALKSQPGVRTIIVRTSQHAFRFYEKMGFMLTGTTKDYWGVGLDLYEMSLREMSLRK
jgi:ribosomal-protein-alanine N-acetyltransferase